MEMITNKTIYRPQKSQPAPVTNIHHITLYNNLTRVAWTMGMVGIPYDVVQIIVGMLGAYKPRTIKYWKTNTVYCNCDWSVDQNNPVEECVLEWHEPTQKYWPSRYWSTCIRCNISTSRVKCAQHGLSHDEYGQETWDRDNPYYEMCKCYELMCCKSCHIHMQSCDNSCNATQMCREWKGITPKPSPSADNAYEWPGASPE
jgi:hypothetical protein